MNLSNYAAERAVQAEQLPPPPEVIYMDLTEITLHDVSAERQQKEYAEMLDPDDFDIEAADCLGYDDNDRSTNTYTDGFNPYELNCSGGRAFSNRFSD